MAILEYEGVGISAMAAAVPHTVIKNYEYTQYFPKEQVKEVVDKIGIFERRFADEKTCSSDLCFAAAERLLEDNRIDRSEIDLLVFISQTPDYRMPATSVILQHRLGLSNSTIAFDINLGCSAFMYGMSVVYAMMEQKGLRKALILDGETRSKVYSPKDRRTAFFVWRRRGGRIGGARRAVWQKLLLLELGRVEGKPYQNRRRWLSENEFGGDGEGEGGR